MKKRLCEIDLARAIVIMILPMTHVYEYLGYQSQMSDILSDRAVSVLTPFYLFFTVFGAPLFMIFMGMNMIFTRKSAPTDYLKRGVILLFVEVGFNLIRYILPGLIGTYISGVANETGVTILFWMNYGLINSDIFALAGFGFILIALFKKLKFKPVHVLIASVALFTVDRACYSIVGAKLAESCDVYLNELFGHIIYVNEDSIFPLFRWFIFIAVGYCFGSYINQKNIFEWVGIASLISTAGFFAYSIIKGLNPFYFYNVVEHSNNLDIIVMLGELSMALLFLSVVVFIYRTLKLERFEKFNIFIVKYSSCISYDYAIQWIIIGWIMFITCGCGVWGTKAINTGLCMLIIVAITVASYFFGRILQKFVKKHIV